MKCPACDSELMEMAVGGVKVDACHGGCGGIWFDAFELQRLEKPAAQSAAPALHLQRDPKLQVDHARRRECPRCNGIKLKRHFFSAKKQVEVDHCPNCGGYWLDAGEWEKIRTEKQAAHAVKAGGAEISMEAIRFLYQQKLTERPQV